MIAVFEYIDLLHVMLGKQSWGMQKQIGDIFKAKVCSCKFLARTCIDKQLVSKIFLFTTAGTNSTLI